jgi:hypothetical protein
MPEIKLVNNVPMTLNIIPTTSNTGGMRSAQGEEMSGTSEKSPIAVSTARNAVPYSVRPGPCPQVLSGYDVLGVDRVEMMAS